MRTPYCCDGQKFRDYYITQAGQGLSGFEGSKIQRGHGLGSLLSGLVKASAPLLKKGALAMGKKALQTGLNMAQEYLNEPKKTNKRKIKTRNNVILSRGKRRKTSKRVDIFN